jgi:hypothetical protein
MSPRDPKVISRIRSIYESYDGKSNDEYEYYIDILPISLKAQARLDILSKEKASVGALASFFC